MKQYDPEQPLISLHIPKCGGQSVTRVLRSWFGSNFFVHYFQAENKNPEKRKFSGGICIHGHFNNEKGFGASQYYPKADQFITFIRDPLEIATSNYFFWKNTARERQLKLGIINEGGDHDYRDIDDFFLKRDTSHILNFIPFNINKNNYKKIVDEDFIFIGLIDFMQESIDILSGILGFKKIKVERVNVSKRDEFLSEKIKQKFVRENEFVINFYMYIKKQFKAKYRDYIT